MRKRPYEVPIVGKISQEPHSLMTVSIPDDPYGDAKQQNFYDDETEESTDPWDNVKFN